MDAREFEKQFKARSIPDIIIPTGLNCNRCADSGFVWVDVDGIAAWCFCRCIEGKLKHKCDQFKLPIYDYEMERLFKARPFPYKAFIPSSFKSFDNGLESKARAFKADLRLSEKFWLQVK